MLGSFWRAGLRSWGAVGISKKELVSFYPQVKPCLEDKCLSRMLTAEPFLFSERGAEQ